MIIYTTEKKFTQDQISELFHSVNWISAEYPTRLYKALMNSSMVITAWDDKKLVGLARAIDDTELVAYIKYVLVNPDYQGQGIAGKLIELLKEKYKDYLYIDGMPDERKNADFYVKHGFCELKDGVPIQIWNKRENLKW